MLLYAGPALDVPHTVTPQQLEVLLNGLLQNEEKTPYSFYIEGQVCLPACNAAAAVAVAVAIKHNTRQLACVICCQ